MRAQILRPNAKFGAKKGSSKDSFLGKKQNMHPNCTVYGIVAKLNWQYDVFGNMNRFK